MAVSNRTLRAGAWFAPVFLLSMIAVQVPITISDSSWSDRSWGDLINAVGVVIIVVLFPLTGALILRSQPRNTIGWLLQGIGVLWGLGAATDSYARYGLLVDPGSLPRPDVAAALNGGIWAPAIGLMGTFLILLFPDGHLPSARWRPAAWLSASTVTGLTVTIYLTPGRLELGPVPNLMNPMGWESAQSVLAVLLAAFLVLLPLCVVVCAAALLLRFRASHGVERQQLKWLATAGALVATAFLIAMAASPLTRAAGYPEGSLAWLDALDTASILSFGLLPVAIGIAIRRHGLYEIDVIINRALVYGSLTAALAAVYLGSVLVLQAVLNPLTAQSDLAVAGSTLAVAAMFRPARTRIQASVDRRFYRRRYDAALTLDDFGSRLRRELDLDAVGDDLRTAVHETVQPTHVSLWLRS